MADPISDLLDDITSGGGIRESVYAPGVRFDATVPEWRFQLEGPDAVRGQLASWYGDPGVFQELQRMPVPGGELAVFTLTWVEGGVDHTAHQAHLLRVEQDRVVSHQVWCGGRWPASLVAEMAGST
jgi:hypothetical protein